MSQELEAKPAPPPSTPSTTENRLSSVPPDSWGLSPTDRLFLVCLCGTVLILICVHLVRLSLRGAETIEIERLASRQFEFQIDVNLATWVEWMQLPGIGEVLARQIVADRDTRGPFRSVEEVDRVPGIGPATLRDILPYLKISAPPTDPPGGA